MKKWNCGIIGAGAIAKKHAKALSEMDNVALKGFCDAGSGRAAELAKQYKCRTYENYDQMLAEKDIDIVAIATPSGLHMEPAIAAAKNSVHVICEKPLEITLERIDAMIAAHEKAGTYLGCIFQNRFNDAMEPLKKAIADERFGKITYAGAYVPWFRNPEYYKDSWHGTFKLDGGAALMNQSIHMIDMLCDLMPPVTRVSSFTNHLYHDIEAEDTGVAILRFENNAMGIIYGTTASFPGQLKRFEITGSKGTVIYLENGFTVWQFSSETEQDKLIREKYAYKPAAGGAADPTAIDYELHRRSFAAFIDAIENKKQFVLDGREARKSVKLVLDIYQNAK